LGNIEVVAFLNPDGSKALIVANYEEQFKTFTINQHNKFFHYSVPGKAVVSISWP
jgi:glucosylceramidase